MDYNNAGFDNFMSRSIASQSSAILANALSGISSSNDMSFDQMQITGSLGDKIQVGGSNVIIDGGNRRIIINDGQVDRIIIGEL